MCSVTEASVDADFPGKNIEEENKKLCGKYPFLAWRGDPLYAGYAEEGELDYGYTWEDEVPKGWRKAFCPKMWDELKAILEKADYVDKFRFVQIKEKYGALRLYYNGVPEEIYDELEAWVFKYEKLSEEACIRCGKPAKYMSIGWISPWCEDCAKEITGAVIDINDVDEYYSAPIEEKQKFYKDLGRQY